MILHIRHLYWISHNSPTSHLEGSFVFESFTREASPGLFPIAMYGSPPNLDSLLHTLKSQKPRTDCAPSITLDRRTWGVRYFRTAPKNLSINISFKIKVESKNVWREHGFGFYIQNTFDFVTKALKHNKPFDTNDYTPRLAGGS